MITVNFETKTVKDGKKVLIDNGIPVDDFEIDTTPVTFEKLEELYQIYKYSVPNTKKYKLRYFKALDANQLQANHLIAGANRQQAKIDLELTLLMGVLNGSLKWPNDKLWFWQSPNDKDFVILKKWFK